MLIVGFGHKARQGKNTAAMAFLSECPIECNASLFAFADELRKEADVAIRQYGCVAALIETLQAAGVMPEWVHPEMGKQRTLYQWWGTDFRRANDPDYWVKKLRRRINGLLPELALITDVRFPNEAAAIHEWGGKLVKVVRTSKPDVDVPAHPSEDALNGFTGWDFELTAGTAAELEKKAKDLYRKIREKK